MTHKQKRPGRAKKGQKAQRQGAGPRVSGRSVFLKKILPIAGAAVAVILLAAAGWWYFGWYRPLQRTVITVNGTEFNMKYYVQMLAYSVTEDPARADATITRIEHNELTRQAAARLGITVSDDEVDQELRKTKRPVNDALKGLVRIQLLTDKMRDGYFDQQIPQQAAQVHIMTMLLDSESRAIEVRGSLQAGQSFTDLAGQFSVGGPTTDSGWHVKAFQVKQLRSSLPVDYAFNSEVGSLSQPIYDAAVPKNAGYWLIKVQSRNDALKQARVYAILLGSQDEAQQVKAKLDAGADFGTLARQLSLWPGAGDNGGDMGTVSPRNQTPAFDGVVFDPKTVPGTVNGPVQDKTVETKGGYWLVKVLEKDSSRQISKDDRVFLRQQAFAGWETSVWNDPSNKVQSYLSDADKAWALKQVGG